MAELPSGIARESLIKSKAWEGIPHHGYNAFRKQYYFFYGTLMDSITLAKVLQLRNRPQLRPAQLVGYSCMRWGPYPALLDGPPGATVYGMAYEIQSPKEVERLRAYETDNYTIKSCWIDFKDGEELAGSTFVWNADKALLKEGAFDLKDWQMNNLEKSCFPCD